MLANAYYKDTDEIEFPHAIMRRIGHLVRNVEPIPGYRAIVNKNNNDTFAIVKAGYKIVQHQEVLDHLNALCLEFPDYGTPVKEIWTSNYGARMKTRYTFKDVDFEITTGDVVHPTLESFSSFDTSMAQRVLIGGFRTLCSNGLMVGKMLAEYKRKHTTSLSLHKARGVLANGMKDYSKVAGLWKSFVERDALMKEVTLYETLPFHKDEKRSIESKIRTQGNIIKWDNDDSTNTKVEINSWELFNILTAEATHNIPDITRMTKVLDGVANGFTH